MSHESRNLSCISHFQFSRFLSYFASYLLSLFHHSWERRSGSQGSNDHLGILGINSKSDAFDNLWAST